MIFSILRDFGEMEILFPSHTAAKCHLAYHIYFPAMALIFSLKLNSKGNRTCSHLLISAFNWLRSAEINASFLAPWIKTVNSLLVSMLRGVRLADPIAAITPSVRNTFAWLIRGKRKSGAGFVSLSPQSIVGDQICIKVRIGLPR